MESEHSRLSPARARAQFRAGLRTATSGWCDGHGQANLVAIPQDWAQDFREFARNNPKPCPILEIGRAGDYTTTLAADCDLRTDLPGYRVYRAGELVAETDNATPYWRDDLVPFLLGCSFTFERALLRAGVPVRHLSAGANVAMYRTTIPCVPGGRIAGPLVVTMRPIPAHLVSDATRITAGFPRTHGSPVHVGDPHTLGIQDLRTPDFGDPPAIEDGDIPMFWACGVTPQVAAQNSRIPYMLTHSPGQMLIMDITDAQLTGPADNATTT